MNNAIDYEKSDWKKANLLGRVKSIEEKSTIEYDGEKPKESFSKSVFNENGNFSFSDFEGHVFEYEYDTNGNIIETREYMSGNPISKTLYNYAADGKLLNKIRYEGKVFSTEEEWQSHRANIPNLPHEGLYLRTNRIIDEKGNESVTIYEEDGQVEYFINEFKDEKSRIVKFKTIYPHSDSFGYQNTWDYDTLGNLVKFKKYKGPENSLEWIFEYKYDQDNRIIQETSLHYMPKSSSKMNEKGHLEDQTKGYFLDKESSIIKSYSYDDAGDLISFSIHKYSGELIKKETFEFSFDEKGNETHYIIKNTDGNIIEETKRKFDSHDNMLERIIVDANGEIHLKETYKYDSEFKVIEQILEEPKKERIEIEGQVYDEVGNWIILETKVLDSKNNETLHTIRKERTIVYF
ncbi:hypothetical protein ACFOUP_15700 [Belliella kenyensis]|uniref:YD repeat-containing protein n=1 Tax=Belliella kenyensis TaxID=1472724 RepID=A0ABV8END9_9BACT|nr:hypothetical protein [Belliella kenyensis]MCH7401997.1 hypothetical protein [Belliella kenyensis]MDN3605161.1 hypothetical protein [Belliella kenyensis]